MLAEQVPFSLLFPECVGVYYFPVYNSLCVTFLPSGCGVSCVSCGFQAPQWLTDAEKEGRKVISPSDNQSLLEAAAAAQALHRKWPCNKKKNTKCRSMKVVSFIPFTNSWYHEFKKKAFNNMGAKQICIVGCRVEAGLAKHSFKAHRDIVKREKLCSPC